MVSIRDRALVEARAKGLDVEAALRHPFRQLLKADILVSAFAVSVMLLIYYTAVGFSLIYLTTVFGFSVKDGNGLGNWNWGFNVVAVLLVGIISDRFRVRKPFMVLGGVIAAVMVVVYLEQAGHHPGYYTIALMLAGLSLGLGIAFAPWMASFTETVEARNPALTATGLAIWGWIQRVVVFASFLIIPAVVSSVTPLVTYGSTVQAYATQYAPQLAFAQAHPAVVADAQKVPPAVIATAQSIPPAVTATAAKIPASVITTATTYSTQLANAQKFAPELLVIETHQALFTKLAAAPANPALQAQAIAAAGGGAKGLAVLTTIAANQAAINGVIAAGPQLQTVQPYAADLTTIAPYSAQLKTIAPYSTELTAMAPYSAQLTALSKVPPAVTAYLTAHAPPCRRPPPPRWASGRPGTGSASAESSSSCSPSRCCAAGGAPRTPSATSRNTKPWSKPNWPSSTPERSRPDSKVMPDTVPASPRAGTVSGIFVRGRHFRPADRPPSSSAARHDGARNALARCQSRPSSPRTMPARRW